LRHWGISQASAAAAAYIFLISCQFAELLVNWSATDYQLTNYHLPTTGISGWLAFWGQPLNWWAIIIWLWEMIDCRMADGLTWLTMTICSAEIWNLQLRAPVRFWCVLCAFYERSANDYRNLCVGKEFSNSPIQSCKYRGNKIGKNITITQQLDPKSMQQLLFSSLNMCQKMINPFSPHTIITLGTHTLRIRNAERPIVYLNKCDYDESISRWDDCRFPLMAPFWPIEVQFDCGTWINLAQSPQPSGFLPPSLATLSSLLFGLLFFHEIRRIILIDWANDRGGAAVLSTTGFSFYAHTFDDW